MYSTNVTDEAEKQHLKRNHPSKSSISFMIMSLLDSSIRHSDPEKRRPRLISFLWDEKTVMQNIPCQEKINSLTAFAFHSIIQFKCYKSAHLTSNAIKKKWNVHDITMCMRVLCGVRALAPVIFKRNYSHDEWIFRRSTLKTSFVSLIIRSTNKMLAQWFAKISCSHPPYECVGVNFRFLCLVHVIYTSLMSFFMA